MFTRAKDQHYYDKHKEILNAKRRQRYLKNKDKEKAAMKKWRANNRSRVNKLNAISKKRNSAKVLARTRLRQLRKRSATPSWANKQEIESFYIKAKMFSELTGIKHVVDHIIPLHGQFVSGLHVQGNLQILTEHENCKKGNKYG